VVLEGFKKFDVQTSDPQVRIHGAIGGSGPPLLLIHGNPLTHIHWHRVAPRLAEDFTVVATDLRGYGDSGKPRGLPDHSNYTFRRMAQDQVEVMAHFGYTRFGVAGHDRGGRTAYRMALDHADKVARLCCVDILPTHHVWTHVTRQWALNSYHWLFLAQPYDFPETLLRGKEEYYIRLKLGSHGLGKGGIPEETMKEYVRCCTPEQIHGVCEDYRAAATLDFEMDRQDFEAGRRITCPLLVIVGGASHTAKLDNSFQEAWRPYATDIVCAVALPCGHYPAEQAPEETYTELHEFFQNDHLNAL
jgi:haloacetate dehalogenase